MAVTLPDASARLAHAFLDLVVAHDVAHELAEAEQADTPGVGQAEAADIVGRALNSEQMGELFDFQRQPDGSIKYDMGPMLIAVGAPLFFMATELAGCAQITLDEVIAHCRDYIETHREDPSPSSSEWS